MTGDLSGRVPCALPGGTLLQGYGVGLEPFDAARHMDGLYAALGGPDNASLWDWILHGPFDTQEALEQFFVQRNDSGEWRTMVILDGASGACLGTASYMRLRPDHGSAEIGAVLYGPSLQRSRAGTAAFYLMASHLMEDLGYRRFEWKCNALNLASNRAARRYGFTFEGCFRQDYVWRGGNRDTNWYSMLDHEWPGRSKALTAWLSARNFDQEGRQRQDLAAFRELFSGLHQTPGSAKSAL